MSFKLIFGITVCSSLMALTSQAVVSEDYVPKSKEEASYPGIKIEKESNDNEDINFMNPFKEMTEEEMMKNRETDHY